MFKGLKMLQREGVVKCGKILRGQAHPEIPRGFTKVNVSSMSNNSNIYRNLSPMLIGPVSFEESLHPNEYYPDGLLPGYKPIYREDGKLDKQLMCSQTFERYWQGSKIYEKELKDGVLQKCFFVERGKMQELEKEDKKRRRRKYPVKDGLPISSLYYGQLMDYITSRKLVYVPIYMHLVRQLPEYMDLYQRVKNGENLLIVGPDGRDISIDENTMRAELENPMYPFGHEMVICSMLKNINLFK